jgi:hypothetical protein
MAAAILLSSPFRPRLPLTYRPSIRPTPHRQAGIRVEPGEPRPFAQRLFRGVVQAGCIDQHVVNLAVIAEHLHEALAHRAEHIMFAMCSPHPALSQGTIEADIAFIAMPFDRQFTAATF